MSSVNCLLDGDLLGARSSLLRYNNREDTVLQARLDVVLVDTVREGKGAVEFSDRAFADPVAVLVVRLGHGLVSRLIVVVLRSVGSVEFTLRSALDHQGLGVGEFDVDALLRNAGQFAVEVVAFFALIGLYHIKSDGLNPINWRWSALMQIQRPPPLVVVSSRRRGVLVLPDQKQLVSLDNLKAFADWVWVWVK